MAPRPGFEPGSKPRQGFMIGHYTIGAGLGTTTVLYFNRSRGEGVDFFHKSSDLYDMLSVKLPCLRRKKRSGMIRGREESH